MGKYRTSYPCHDCTHDKGKCVGRARNGQHKYCFKQRIPTNADRIRAMSDEELAKELTRNPSIPCRTCEHYDNKIDACRAWASDFTCVVAYAEVLTLDWLQLPADTVPSDASEERTGQEVAAR